MDAEVAQVLGGVVGEQLLVGEESITAVQGVMQMLGHEGLILLLQVRATWVI